jgi:hypothetical protein
MATSARRAPRDAAEAKAAIERFLEGARSPALLEPGEELLPMASDTFACEMRSGRLILQAWDERRNVSRRVLGIMSETRGKLELAVEKFARREGSVILVDLARPANHEWTRRGARMVFREKFRWMLGRAFPELPVCEVTSEPDLEHSLSPAYPRALLAEGRRGVAAIACPPGAGDAGVLSFGLIWLDYLRKRERSKVIEGLCLFVPAAHARAVALRLRCLHPDAARFDLFAYSEQGAAARVDFTDAGNLDTVLHPCRRPVHDAVLASRLIEAGAQDILRNDGEISFRVDGLEVARTAGGAVLFGLEDRRPLAGHNVAEACRLVREVAALREAGGALYRLSPELWLESRVRREIETIDPSLLAQPVYGQVPAFTAGERGILDLLAVDRAGRLAVIELKAAADLHLPLQALDYWVRVKWRLERGDFGANGYFPGIRLRADAPRLLLVAPALEFHPTTETLLGYFAPGIPVERIGLGLEWRTRLQVLFRASGAAPA